MRSRPSRGRNPREREAWAHDPARSDSRSCGRPRHKNRHAGAGRVASRARPQGTACPRRDSTSSSPVSPRESPARRPRPVGVPCGSRRSLATFPHGIERSRKGAGGLQGQNGGQPLPPPRPLGLRPNTSSQRSPSRLSATWEQSRYSWLRSARRFGFVSGRDWVRSVPGDLATGPVPLLLLQGPLGGPCKRRLLADLRRDLIRMSAPAIPDFQKHENNPHIRGFVCRDGLGSFRDAAGFVRRGGTGREEHGVLATGPGVNLGGIPAIDWLRSEASRSGSFGARVPEDTHPLRPRLSAPSIPSRSPSITSGPLETRKPADENSPSSTIVVGTGIVPRILRA